MNNTQHTPKPTNWTIKDQLNNDIQNATKQSQLLTIERILTDIENEMNEKQLTKHLKHTLKTIPRNKRKHTIQTLIQEYKQDFQTIRHNLHTKQTKLHNTNP